MFFLGINLEGLAKDTGMKGKAKSVKSKAPPAKLPPPAQNVEEEKVVSIEKRKRPGNAKSVQEYIKQQKQKRVDQLKTEREKKSAEMEARKKKLEELRIKSLQLASASKRKKSENVQVSWGRAQKKGWGWKRGEKGKRAAKEKGGEGELKRKTRKEVVIGLGGGRFK